MADKTVVHEADASPPPSAEVPWTGTCTDAESSETVLELYRMLLFVRRFEEAARALFRRGAIAGSIHLCMGEEAVPVGVCSVLEPEDLVACTYRGHGHCLALGMEPVALMAELMHKRTGVCGGRAGSMNIVDREHNLIGCFGIVGGSIGASTGAALSLKLAGEGVAVGFFGEGTMNQGYAFECMNFAAVNELPIVFVCENNLYGEFTPWASVTAGGILPRVRAFGIPAHPVDGNDVCAMRDAARWALEHARSGKGPAFLEAQTYRYNDHARGDPVDYRPPGEMDAWKARDPILVARARLVEQYAVPEADLERLASEVEEEVEAVRVAAVEAPMPDPAACGTEFKEMAEVVGVDG